MRRRRSRSGARKTSRPRRQLYNDGEALRDKGDLKGALEKFKAAHPLGDTPITGLELCKTHRALNQPVEAREACLSVGRIGPIKEETQRSKDARTEAAKIADEEKPKIGANTLKTHGRSHRHASLRADRRQRHSRRRLDGAAPVDPGSHGIVAKVGNGQETRITVDTKEGESKEVEVPVQPPPVEPPPLPPPFAATPAPAPERHRSSFPTVMYVIGGAGVAIGAIGGIVAISKKGDLDDSCASKICGRDQWDNLDSARTWGTVSTVAFILGGASLAIGLIAQPRPPRAAAAPRRRRRWASGSVQEASVARSRLLIGAGLAVTLVACDAIIGLSDFKKGECSGGGACLDDGGPTITDAGSDADASPDSGRRAEPVSWARWPMPNYPGAEAGADAA